MELMKALLTRRSVRSYTSETISEEVVMTAIRAAMQAPSAHNEQPWEFVVVRDAKTLASIAEAHPYAKMARLASGAIVLAANLAREKSKNLWIQDCAAATQNLLLALHDQGVGAVWCALYPYEDRMNSLAAILQIPQGVIPFAVVCFGKPDKEVLPADRFDATRVHHETWAGRSK